MHLPSSTCRVATAGSCETQLAFSCLQRPPSLNCWTCTTKIPPLLALAAELQQPEHAQQTSLHRQEGRHRPRRRHAEGPTCCMDRDPSHCLAHHPSRGPSRALRNHSGCLGSGGCFARHPICGTGCRLRHPAACSWPRRRPKPGYSIYLSYADLPKTLRRSRFNRCLVVG